MPPVPYRRQAGDAPADQMVRRLHVHHLRRTRPAQRATAANDQNTGLVDVQGGVIDPRMIILRPVKHRATPLEYILPPRNRQKPRAKRVRDDAGFHDGKVEQIARQHPETRPLHQRRLIGPDHLAVARPAPHQIVRHRPPGDGCNRAIQLARPQQFRHDRRNSAAQMKPLAQKPPRRLHIGQQGDVIAMGLPILRRQNHPRMMRHRHQMRLCVRRTANRRIDPDRIQERRPCQNA